MKVPEHKHPLELIDLQQEEEKEDDDDDDDDGGGDLTTEEGFRSRKCRRCNEMITMYHRYYYKCIDGRCRYSLHKFCGELSTSLVHVSHPHPLTLACFRGRRKSCDNCSKYDIQREMGYECVACNFNIDISCAVGARKKTIYHPSHPHLLMCAINKPILCECTGCGKKREGVFYNCTDCDTFTIHKDCAFLPKKLLIQQRTGGAFYNTHPLTLSYSFPFEDQKAKHFPKCRVCGCSFLYRKVYNWTYRCDKCLYYAHVDCATSIPSGAAGSRKTIKNFQDADHPRLLHLPFPDETYSLPKHLLFEESSSRSRVEEVSLKHISHQHPLILMEQTSSKKIWCHNPMKKIQLLCNGCVRPITSTMPFFKCDNEQDEHCNFALHEWCIRLPVKIESHPSHSKHPLVLVLNNHLERFFGVFNCRVCGLPCNGFAYCCVECEYYVDVTCGLIPAEITHKAHPNHLLSVTLIRTLLISPFRVCLICQQDVYQPYSRHVKQEPLAFGCKECNNYIHSECALLLPDTIKHVYDKHPMHLSYLPIENHKSEYFCEICEDDLDPHVSFYHCKEDCAQSIHTACAPSILQSETETFTRRRYTDYKAIHDFINIKFGGIHNTPHHPHPLSFAQGTVLDGQYCRLCGNKLRYEMIFKCLECKFAIDYNCCDHRLKKI